MKRTTIRKMGNSQGILIPKELLAKANINKNVVISVVDNKLVISNDVDVSLNNEVRAHLQDVSIELLPKNILSLKGLKIPLNEEQITLLNNQLQKHG